MANNNNPNNINHDDADDNDEDERENFVDAVDGLEELALSTAERYVLLCPQVEQNFEQCWAELGLDGQLGVEELNPACIAMLDSLESRERFLREWDVNRRRLLDGMRNCPAFQGILDPEE